MENDLIIFNVGGLPYTIMRSGIEKHPDSYLHTVIQPTWLKENTPVEIQRDGRLFRFILAYLVNSTISRELELDSSEVLRMNVMVEADFYGITDMVELLKAATPLNANPYSSFVALHQSIERNDGLQVGYDFNVREMCKIKYRQYCGIYEQDDSELVTKSCEQGTKALKSMGVGNPFAVGIVGEVDFESLPKLYVKKDDDEKLFLGHLGALKVDRLLAFCTPSTCGDLLQQDSHIDPMVRNGGEIVASRLCYSTSCYMLKTKVYVHHHGFETYLRDFVAKNLLDCKREEISLALNKLQIYSEGGYFKPHTDTPTHDPAMFLGTVVVCLPSAHRGGDLVVRNHGEECVFSFDKTSAELDKFQFAAFYGDCEHEVLPVTSGHRVVLTYSILRVPATAAKRARINASLPYKEPSHVCPMLRSCLHKGIQNTAALAEKVVRALQTAFPGRYVGIYVSHTYDTSVAITAASLKGADRWLYDQLTQKGIPVSVVPVVQQLDYKDILFEGDQGLEDADISETDLAHQNFSVTLIGALPDARLEEHRDLPFDTPFLTPWSNPAICVREKRECIAGKNE